MRLLDLILLSLIPNAHDPLISPIAGANLLSSRVASGILSFALITNCLGYALAELKAPAPNIDLGVIDIGKGPVSLQWTIINDDSNALRLVRIDTNYPSIRTVLDAGILAPGASTNVLATFDPQNAVGRMHGTLKVIAEYGPIVNLTFQGEVKTDIEPRTALETVITNIGSRMTTVAGKPIVFMKKSGAAFVPTDISISGEPFIGAHITANNDCLEIIPYVYEPTLPAQQSGHTILKVHFKYDIGTLTYDIPISWQRADPLRIAKTAPGTYTISYTDNCKFAVRSLAVAPGLVYTTRFSDDGLTLWLEPRSHIQTRVLRRRHAAQKTYSLAKVRTSSRPKPKVNSKISAKAKVKLQTTTKYIDTPGVLIQLETTHPYRHKVVIRGDE